MNFVFHRNNKQSNIFLGSYSATHHMLNSESRKYFKQILGLSGVAINWNGYVSGNHRCLIDKFALKHNRSTDIKEVIEFLKHVPEEDLVHLSQTIYGQSVEINDLWWPIIEGLLYDTSKGKYF